MNAIRFRRDQIPQRIGRIVSADAFLVSINLWTPHVPSPEPPTHPNARPSIPRGCAFVPYRFHISNCCPPSALHTRVVAYAVGIVLALVLSGLARLAKFDRPRVFYPLVMAVIAVLYVLFAVIGRSVHALIIESLIAAGFLFMAFAGFKFNLWLVVAALAAHGLMDFVHPHLVTNPGVPTWWPAFCGAYDIVAAGWLAWLLTNSTLLSKNVSPPK